MYLSETHVKMRGLTDLLCAVTAQIENGDSLQIEGAMMLVSISSNIERELEAYINNQEDG